MNLPAISLMHAQVAAVAGYLRENPDVAKVYGLAPADADLPATTPNDPLDKRYHLGPDRTAGMEYDDRLNMRLCCSSDKAYEYVNTPPSHGGLRCKRLGKRIVVTEQAVREFLGDLKTAA